MDHLPLFLGSGKSEWPGQGIQLMFSHKVESEVSQTTIIRGLTRETGGTCTMCLTSWHGCWLEDSALFHMASHSAA